MREAVYLVAILAPAAIASLLVAWRLRIEDVSWFLVCAAVGGVAVVSISLCSGIVNWLITLLHRPRTLPKLDFEAGIPEQWRTAVAVPVL